MVGSSVRRWCPNFDEIKENALDNRRSGRPSSITDDLLPRVDEFIKQDQRVTPAEISQYFSFISCAIINEIVTVRLNY